MVTRQQALTTAALLAIERCDEALLEAVLTAGLDRSVRIVEKTSGKVMSLREATKMAGWSQGASLLSRH